MYTLLRTAFAPSTLKLSSVFSFPRLNIERCKSGYEGDGKTTVNILNTEINLGLMIDTISEIGFRLNNGTVTLGPLAIFHRSILSWKVPNPASVNSESLSLFKVLEPKVDILVIGLGDIEDTNKNRIRIIKYCKTMKLNVEIFPTEDACATFNFLNYEGRNVAALLLPPKTLRLSENDFISSKGRLEQENHLREIKEKLNETS